MPVTFDATARSTQTASLSLTVALTVASNAVLLGIVAMKGANSVSAMDYNGVAMTLLGQSSATGQMRLEIWGLTAPASGTHNLHASFVSPVGTRYQLAGVSYLNARSVSPFSKIASATQSTTVTAVLNVSGTNTGLVVGAFACGEYISASNMTTRFNDINNDMGMLVGDTAGAGVLTSLSAVVVGAVGNMWAQCGVCIYFSAVATTSLRLSRMLTGIGG